MTKPKQKAPTPEASAAMEMRVEVVDLDSLKRHPRNYREHPEDQIAHLAQSIKEHGIYRNIVVARDGTILAGHGVVVAARSLGLERLPVVRVDVAPEDPEALRLLIGDNEIARLADIDDFQLTDILKTLHDLDPAELLGSGYDTQQLAALVMTTRTRDEIKDFDAAAEWVGMPEHDQGPLACHLLVICNTAEDRDAFLARAKVSRSEVREHTGRWTLVWPPETDVADDVKNVRLVQADA